MPESCTCGAELPPDALFCHKCGKPQRDIAPQERPEEALEPVAKPTFSPTAPSFRNPVAVRVGMMLASLAALLSSIPLIGLLSPVWFFSAGFLSPFAYRRRTGEPVTMRNGARLGWITGVIGFVISTIVTLLTAGSQLATEMRQQLRNMPIADANMQRTVEALQTPLGIGVLLVAAILVFFAYVMALCTAGGALGARIARKD